MASVVVQVRVDEAERARWLEMAKSHGLSLSDFIRGTISMPSALNSAEVYESVLSENQRECHRMAGIIAEKDAEIARLEKRIEATSISVRHGKRLSAQIKEASDAIFAEKSPQVIARENGEKNAAGGVKGHKLNCRCNLCSELRGKK